MCPAFPRGSDHGVGNEYGSVGNESYGVVSAKAVPCTRVLPPHRSLYLVRGRTTKTPPGKEYLLYLCPSLTSRSFARVSPSNYEHWLPLLCAQSAQADEELAAHPPGGRSCSEAAQRLTSP